MTEQDFKDNWIKALRSGDYGQTQGTLHSPEGFCCLGVFCEINGHKVPQTFWSDTKGDWATKGDKNLYDYCGSKMPTEVYLKGIEMNDTCKSFLEIADMIEQEWVIE